MSTTVIRYSPNLGYGTFNPTSIPIKQYIQNGATNVCAGMPQKTGYADNTATFAQGRNTYIRAPVASIYLQDKSNPIQCNTGVIRVDAADMLSRDPNKRNLNPKQNQCDSNKESTTKSLYIVKPLVENGEYTPNTDIEAIIGLNNGSWSRSNHTIHNRHRNQIACNASAGGTCLLNGKQNNIMSSQELISRRKNRAIGQGSKNTKDGLSFNDNNLNGTHTNYLAVSNARRRTRNGGYVVPPKCRGHGSGPNGPFGSLGNAGTGPNLSKGQVFDGQAPPKTACGERGWAVTTLLGNNILTRDVATNTKQVLENSNVTGGIITVTKHAKSVPFFKM
jgi:hypothetical protein